MVAIHNIEETIEQLRKLQHDAAPLWGSMTPQHMVEHLTMTIRASQGKIPIKQLSTTEEANAIKQRLITVTRQCLWA